MDKSLFVLYNNTLCVEYTALIDEGVISIDNLKGTIRRNKVVKIRKGGHGRKCLLEFYSFPKKLQNKIIEVNANISVDNNSKEWFLE